MSLPTLICWQILSPLQMGRVRHEPGSVIELDQDQARPLVAIGVLAEVTPHPDQPQSPTNATPAGGGEASREARLLAAIDTLNPDDPTLWTKSGRPQTQALETVSGLAEVSASQRDAAWAAYQAKKGSLKS